MIAAERIRHLTPQQRHLLLERLQITGETVSEKELVAYVVATPGRMPAPETLQAHCRSSLPEFMIPTKIIQLPSLPQHPNGKVNRSALPSPDAIPEAQTSARPQNETETRLARIWSELLRIETIGPTDNFFRLGGHSLLALQVMARVRDAFKVNLPLKALFDAPTIEGLSAAIAKVMTAPQRPIPRVARRSDSDSITIQT